MYLGEQLSDLSDRKLTWVAQLGVEHIVANTIAGTGIQAADGTWSSEKIGALRKRVADFGITIDVLNLGQEAQPLSRLRFPGLWLGAPSRDAEIETIKQNIRAAGEAGIPCLKYNVNVLGVLRTERTPGRGGARYSTFDIDRWTDHSLSEAGPLPAEKLWENVTYFLERVIPVAEQAGVRLAAHPHDPPLPRDRGLRGVHSILGSVEGMLRFAAIAPSRANGFNFCQGTVAEMCQDPAREVIEAIRTVGADGRIAMVHLRNIKGGFLKFQEVYPDNGDVDFLEALRAYRDIGYEGMLCPDHVPQSDADPDNERQHSFCLGYFRGLLHALERGA